MTEGLRIIMEQLFGAYWLGFEPPEAPGQCAGQLQLELDIERELTDAGYVRDRDGRWYRAWWGHGVLSVESMPDDFDPLTRGT